MPPPGHGAVTGWSGTGADGTGDRRSTRLDPTLRHVGWPPRGPL